MQRRNFIATAALGSLAAAISTIPQKAMASSAPTGFIDVTEPTYGADPSGASSSTSAFLSAISDAINNGLGLWIPSGTYDLISFPATNLGSIVIKGAGKELVTLIGSSSKSFVMPTANANIVFSGMNITGFRRVFQLNSLIDIESIEIHDCAFENILHQIVGSGAGVNIDEINRFVFKNNVAKHIGDANSEVAVVKLSARKVYHCSIEGNEISNIGNSTKSSKSFGFYVKAATYDDDHGSKTIISGNFIRGVRSNSTEDCGGIMVLGGQAIITGNHIEDVLTSNVSSTDCEGIYTKCQNSIISFNTLINCGGYEAVIMLKGRNRGETPSQGRGSSGFDNIIIGNTIRQDFDLGIFVTGIGVSMDGCTVSQNHIVGTSKGIAIWADAKGCIVSNNKLYGLQQYNASYYTTGIICSNPNDLQILDNQISELSSEETCYAIYLNCSETTYSGVHIRGNWISNLFSNTTNYSRGIALNLHANGFCEKLIVESNHLSNMDMGIQPYNLSTVAHSAAIYNSFTNCTSKLGSSGDWTVEV